MGIFDVFNRKKVKQLENQLTQTTEQIKNLEEVMHKSLQNSRITEALSYTNTAIYPSWNTREEINKSTCVDDLYSIIKMLAQAAAGIPLVAYEIKDDKAMKSYKDMGNGNTSQSAKQMAKKAMLNLPEQDKLVQFLDNPFYNLNKYEGYVGLYWYLFSAGEVFLYKDKLEYGVNKGLNKLVMLHPDGMTILISLEFPQTVIGYIYNFRGQQLNFTPDEIIHIKYFNPTIYNGNEWRGLSPIKALRERLTRNQANLDNSVAQMQNGGTPAIVFIKDADGSVYDENGKETTVLGQHKINMSAFMKNRNNVGGVYFAGGEMGKIDLGTNLVDSESLELGKVDFGKIANAYGISTVLLNDNTASTESNVQIQTKRMYTVATIPNVWLVRDAFIKSVLPEFKQKRYWLCEDTSGIKELQDDQLKQAQALKLMDFITNNEKREATGYDKDEENELMNEYLVASGTQLLSDLEMTEDIEPTPDYNADE